MTTINYQGDPKLFIDKNGSFLDFRGGQPIMDQGLENAALISLFTKKGWHGNAFLSEEEKIGSDFQEIATRTITSSSLENINQEAKKALDKPFFGDIEAETVNPVNYVINTDILIKPPGYDSGLIQLEKNGENWILQKINPAHSKYDTPYTVNIRLTAISTGSTINFEYGGTAIFTTKYSDGTSYVGVNPPLKDFGVAAERSTLIIVSNPLEVTTIDLGNNNISTISSIEPYTALEYLHLYTNNLTDTPDISSNTALIQLLLHDNNLTNTPDVSNNVDLDYLYLHTNNLTTPPDVSNNLALTNLQLHYNSFTSPPDVTNNTALEALFLDFNLLTSAPDISNNTALSYFWINDNNISESLLSAMVDELYINRVALGGNFCNIQLQNNNGLTADAIAKIDGTGAYSGDGLIDNGCTVTY